MRTNGAQGRRPGRPTLSSTIGWDAKLATVAGRHAPKIEKAFGVRTVGELLRHLPAPLGAARAR